MKKNFEEKASILHTFKQCGPQKEKNEGANDDLAFLLNFNLDANRLFLLLWGGRSLFCFVFCFEMFLILLFFLV